MARDTTSKVHSPVKNDVSVEPCLEQKKEMKWLANKVECAPQCWHVYVLFDGLRFFVRAGAVSTFQH